MRSISFFCTTRRATYVLAFAAAAALAAGCEDASEAFEVEPSLVEDSIDDSDAAEVDPWSFIGSFETEPQYDVRPASTCDPITYPPGSRGNHLVGDLAGDDRFGMHAIRGQAVGYEDDDGCSAWLVGDGSMVTADHCSDGNGDVTQLRLGYHEGINHRADLLPEFRSRIQNLGLALNGGFYFDGGLGNGWEYKTGVNELDQSDIFFWHCVNVDRDHNRDIRYYDCDPKRFLTTIGSTSRIIDVYPGNIFGHLPTEVGSNYIGTGDSIQLFHFETQPYLPEPSAVYFAARTDLEVKNNDAVGCSHGNPCFSVTKYSQSITTGGSSGGAYIRTQNGTAIGTHSGEWWPTYTPRGSSMTSNHIAAHSVMDVPTQSIDDSTRYYSSMAGSNSGLSSTELLCPDDFYVAGLVGTTEQSNGPLGQLGAICYPYPQEADEGGFRDYGVARVVVTGSLLTVDFEPEISTSTWCTTSDYKGRAYSPITRSDDISLSRYLQERRTTSSFHDDYGMAQKMVCPPGYGVGGIAVRESSSSAGYLSQIDGLRCVELDGSSYEDLLYPSGARIGTGGIAQAGFTDCDTNPNHTYQNEIATGIKVYTLAGLYSGGVSLQCTDTNSF